MLSKKVRCRLARLLKGKVCAKCQATANRIIGESYYCHACAMPNAFEDPREIKVYDTPSDWHAQPQEESWLTACYQTVVCDESEEILTDYGDDDA